VSKRSTYFDFITKRANVLAATYLQNRARK